MQKNYVSVKLSTQWTEIGFYVLILCLLVFVPILFYMSFNMYESVNWVALAFNTVLMVLIILCLIYMSKAHIKDNVIYLKKFYKPEASYPIDQIESVQVYETRKDSYVLLTVKNEEKSEKYLLMTSKVFYAGEVRNTVSILKEIVAYNKDKKNDK